MGEPGLDALLFMFLNGLVGPPLDTVFWCITELGRGEYATLITSLILIVALKRIPVTAIITVALAALLAGFLTERIKYAVDRPRPLQTLGPEKVHVTGEELRQRSFPSGHTACAFALCVAGCSFVRTRRAWVTGLTLATCVGLSRVMVGAHYPGDVVAGAVLGALCGLLLRKLEMLGTALWSRWRARPA